MRLNRLVIAFALLTGEAGKLESQTDSAPPSTRIEAMERARDEKAARLEPASPEPLETRVETVVNALQLTGNWSVSVGGLRPGSGLALGPAYRQPGLLEDNLEISVTAVGSHKLYYGAALALKLGRLLDDRATFEYVLRRLDSPSLEYYGPGNDSKPNGLSNYRLEELSNVGLFSFKPFRRYFEMGGLIERRQLNVGPGTASSSPSTELLHTPSRTPGIDRQTNYLIVAPSVTLNLLDSDGDPHAGAYLHARYGGAKDQKRGSHSFRFLNATIEQYAPFLNKKRYFAFRGQGRWTFTGDANVVPFYMQQVLGGPNDLRSYPRFRFYGNNSLLFNAEYRWEVSPALDMAAFTDWGKVFETPGAMALSELHGGAGIGFRFKTRNNVAMRIDFAVGGEGFGFAWTFGNIFERYSARRLR